MSSLLKIISDSECIVYKDSEKVLDIGVNKISSLSLRKGTFYFEVVNKKDESHRISFDYRMETDDMEDLLRISFKKNKISSQNEIMSLTINPLQKNLKRYTRRKENKYSILDTGTNFEIPLKYDYVGDFHEGLAVVGLNKCLHRCERYGYIDLDGNEVIPLIYKNAKPFNELGLAEVQTTAIGNNIGDHCIGWINKEGVEIIPCTHTFSESFDENGFVRVQKNYCSAGEDAGCGYYDKNGNIVIPLEYGYSQEMMYNDKHKVLYLSLTHCLFRVSKNKKWGVVNRNNKFILPIEYDTIDISEEDIILAKKGDECYSFVVVGTNNVEEH